MKTERHTYRCWTEALLKAREAVWRGEVNWNVAAQKDTFYLELLSIKETTNYKQHSQPTLTEINPCLHLSECSTAPNSLLKPEWGEKIYINFICKQIRSITDFPTELKSILNYE